MAPQPPERRVTVSEARDQLGTLVQQVSTTGTRIRLTYHREPAGVLISVDDNQTNLQMHLGGAHGIKDAITNWASVREAARTHPQALVLPSRGMAVLLGTELEHRLDHGHPPLPAEVGIGETGFVDLDGHPIPPGTYSVGDQVVTLSADTTEVLWPEKEPL
ncbi:type II toxin-antitoxin system Phd/YefM family antitoxin [Nocardiopsis terrae]|uniref:type II toxin-antitoxin system Phd/YefM family antitoxin n=1 Tax=Streptomyces sp. NPDC057554 TaxID=3350538 RepID=UPI0036CA86AA